MSIEKIINDAWENKDQVNPNSDQSLKDTINQVISDLDSGKSRVAEKINNEWVVNQWIKQAILLSFKTSKTSLITGGPYAAWFDKIPNKTKNWSEQDFKNAGFRYLPNGVI